MTRPNILLLTDNFPCNNYSGGIVNQQLCYFLLEEDCKLFCTLLKQPNITEQPDSFIKTHIKKIEFKKPVENSDDPSSYSHTVDELTKQICTFIKDNHIDTVWCPIQGETLLRIFAAIKKRFKSKIRLVAQIWDPIEWPLYDLGYNEADSKRILQLFDKTMQQADFILTASEPMNTLYQKKYHVPCMPIFSSYRQTTYCPPRPKNHDNTFTIVFAGQTYAKKGIHSLIDALEQMGWHHQGKQIRLKYFGPNYDDYMVDNPHISITNHIPQDDLIREESKADLLYCPYYFEDAPVFQTVSTQSYPSKIITYIPAHAPILVHSDSTSTIYQDFKKHQCGFLLDSLEVQDIVTALEQIIKTSKKDISQLIQNADQLFQANFTREHNKKVFLKALNIPYDYDQPSYRILEVNNLDLPGKRWNGYDLTEYINRHTHHLASQIVTYKTSHNPDVTKIFTPAEQQLEYKLLEFEANHLSVHSCLSCSSPILLEKDVFKNADLVHLHLIHNMKLSLVSLIEICNKKPTVITIHDPWTFTGRCVWLYDCKKYLTGCYDCPNLDNLFPLKCDNCHELWALKKYVYDQLDVDYVVTTEYMADLFKESPLTQGKRVHVIPFGIKTDEFYNKVTQKAAKKHYNIPDDHIVIFHRAQFLSKGTEYVIDALKELDVKQKITIITCSEKGRLDPVKDKYNIIDLGDIKSDELVYAYNACDFFLSPSIGESFCMMAVEAMSCAKPVVIFDNTALPSVTFAPDCGVLAKDRDSHDLMRAIRWMIEDEQERLRRGKLARKLAVKNYDLDTYNQRIQDLYKEVAARKHNYVDYETMLNSQPQDTPSVLALKAQLNSLTGSLFPKRSPQYTAMLYPLPRSTKNDPDFHIAYGDPNTQLLINQYNNDLIANIRDFNPYQLYGPLPVKIAHKLRTFMHLLLRNRQQFITVVREKLHGVPTTEE